MLKSYTTLTPREDNIPAILPLFLSISQIANEFFRRCYCHTKKSVQLYNGGRATSRTVEKGVEGVKDSGPRPRRGL